MASSSSSTPALQPLSEGRSYHAFLNHLAPDTRMTFAVHLQRALLSRGLTAFLDKDSMQVTENISRQIEDAIQTSSVHVAIFWERYAESSWCLNELHLMVQTGAPIIPVFYHVNPAELQSEDGKYSQALRSLEMKKSSEGKPRYDSDIIQKWREALASVASVADKSRLDLEAVDGRPSQPFKLEVTINEQDWRFQISGNGIYQSKIRLLQYLNGPDFFITERHPNRLN